MNNVLHESDPLALSESKRLVELEEIIERGVSTFIQVGEALAEIRDSRLYRIEYDNFEDYCREEWNMSKPYATQVISAATVVKNLEVVAMATKPTSERQARPLTKLSTPQEQQEAWKEAVEESGGNPTAKHVEAAVAKRVPRPIEHTFTPEQEQAAAEAEQDSEALWTAKSYAKKLNKRDRALFLAWVTQELK